MNLSTLLKTFLILQLSDISVKCSCLDDYKGDGFCDEENNNEGCNHDEGKIIFNLERSQMGEFSKKPANAWIIFE